MCAFCVILGDTIPRVLQSVIGEEANGFVKFLASRQVVTFLLTVGISYPLSLYRDIEKLSHASALALVRLVPVDAIEGAEPQAYSPCLCSMVVIVVSVAVRGPGVADSLKGDSDMRWTVLESGFFEAIGVISFAFVVSRSARKGPGCVSLTCQLDRCATVPPQFSAHLRFPEDPDPRSIRQSDARLDPSFGHRMSVHVHLWLPRLHRSDSGKHPQQLCRRRLAHQCRTSLRESENAGLSV